MAKGRKRPKASSKLEARVAIAQLEARLKIGALTRGDLRALYDVDDGTISEWILRGLRAVELSNVGQVFNVRDLTAFFESHPDFCVTKNHPNQ